MTDPFVLSAVLKAASKVIASAQAANDAPLKELFEPGDRKTVRVNGVKLGTISKSEPKDAWKITDDGAFVRYCEKRHPSVVTYVPVVSEAWRESFLKHPYDPETGELADGVESVAASTPAWKVDPTPEAIAMVEAVLLPSLRELEAGR